MLCSCQSEIVCDSTWEKFRGDFTMCPMMYYFVFGRAFQFLSGRRWNGIIDSKTTDSARWYIVYPYPPHTLFRYCRQLHFECDNWLRVAYRNHCENFRSSGHLVNHSIELPKDSFMVCTDKKQHMDSLGNGQQIFMVVNGDENWNWKLVFGR